MIFRTLRIAGDKMFVTCIYLIFGTTIYCQTDFYDIVIEQSNYEPLEEYQIAFDGRIQEDFRIGYDYSYLTGFISNYYHVKGEGISINCLPVFGCGGIDFDVNSIINRSMAEIFTGEYANRALTNPNEPSYIKIGYDNTDRKSIIVQFENLGLRADLESDNSSDHYLNFQFRYSDNGDIEFIMGPTYLTESMYYDSDLGFLNTEFDPTGFPKLGINYPFNNFDTIYHYVQGSFDDPLLNFGQEEQEVLQGMPPEGWTVRWIDLFTPDTPIEEVECMPTSGFYPFEYTGGKVLWKHTVFDSTLIGHIKPEPPTFFGLTPNLYTTTGYNHIIDIPPFHTLVEEDFIITTDIVDYIEPSGAIIQKLDIETGEVLWRTQFDYRDNQTNEYVAKIEILDNQLWAYGIHVNTEFEGGFAQRGVLFTRIYDLETGELIRHTVADTDDPNVYQDRRGLEYVNEITQIGKDTFEILEYDFIDDRPVIKRDWMTTDGIAFLSDTIIGKMSVGDLQGARQIDQRKMWKVGIDSFYFVECYEPEDDTDPNAFFDLHLMDTELNFIHSWRYDRSNLGDFNGIFIEDVNDSHIRLRTFNTSTRHFIIDRNSGELVDVRFEDERFHDAREFDITESPMTDSLEIVAVIINELGSTFNSDVDEGELEFVYSTSQGDSTTNYLIPNKDRYYMFPSEVIMLPDKDVLIRVRERRWSVAGGAIGYLPGFWSYMRIDSEELLGITSTKETPILNTFQVFPNPASDFITIEFPEIFSGRLLLYNLEGYLVRRAETEGAYNYGMDITNLPAGVYTLRAFSSGSGAADYYSSKVSLVR
jgi:hypothetical protein